jgi:hypothetical protein
MGNGNRQTELTPEFSAENVNMITYTLWVSSGRGGWVIYHGRPWSVPYQKNSLILDPCNHHFAWLETLENEMEGA